MFYFGPPFGESKVQEAEREFFYAEWRAALEAVLEHSDAKILNGYWLLKNSSLRYSADYWRDRVSLALDGTFRQEAITWIDGSRSHSQDRSLDGGSVLEVCFTRFRWSAIGGALAELQTAKVVEGLQRVQELVHSSNLDFLRTKIRLSQHGEMCVIEASPELPTSSDPAFRSVLYDFV